MTRRLSNPHKLGDFQHEATWLQDSLLLPNGLVLIPLRSADLFPSIAHLDNAFKETRTTTSLGHWRSGKFQQPMKILQNRSPLLLYASLIFHHYLLQSFTLLHIQQNQKISSPCSPPSLTPFSSLLLHLFFFQSFSTSVLPSLIPISKIPAQASHAPLPFSPPQNHKPHCLH